MAQATTWSAVSQSPVNQTASPVSVPLPLDLLNEGHHTARCGDRVDVGLPKLGDDKT